MQNSSLDTYCKIVVLWNATEVHYWEVNIGSVNGWNKI